MMDTVPTSSREWEEAAKGAGVFDITLYDAAANAGNLPSGSKMEQGVYLTFRSYWTDNSANRISPEILGISREVHAMAQQYLSKHKDYKLYIDDVSNFRNVRRPVGKLPNLGIFTLVRHFHQQITKVDVLEASSKHIISPVKTRSRTAAAAAAANPALPNTSHRSISRGRRLSFEKRDNGESRRPTPTGTNSRSPSTGHPSLETPLAHRGKLLPGTTMDPISREPSEDRHSDQPAMAGISPAGESPTVSSLSSRSGVSATAANILYAPSADEMIVNTYLILLLDALGACNEDVIAGWHIDRLALKHTFGSSQLEARTDGFLRMPDGGPVVAIVEAKSHVRKRNQLGIKMQETTQMVAWIAEQDFPPLSSRRFVILSQDRHEIYITVPQYDAKYIEYLKGETDANTPLSLLEMRSFGPWDINDKKSLHHLCCYLLALTLSASHVSNAS
ncbi:hypothetical protein FQN50_004273 [Emmonsiellopsis sp. PD_5]|nr:hypothetical protein FQN50_004273 [Emmonsiellopsis sp. PD_5]